jgi:cobalt-zinc-cadmium resistance protein CzcA
LTPVLAAKVLPAGEGANHDTKVLAVVEGAYRKLFRFALRHSRLAIALGLLPVAAAIALIPFLGHEFMPKLEEGNFWIRATLPMSISLEQSARYVGRMRSIVLGKGERIPEIETVVSQVGRPDDGTDVSGFHNVELFAPLRPRSEWRHGVTKEQLTGQLSRELREAFPGVVFNFSQAISDNVEEAMSGVKGENTVKVVGPDLMVNEQKAQEIVAALSGVRGVDDLGMFPSLGQPDIRITPDREACGRYGLNVGDVESVVQGAIGGQVVTQVYEGEKHFDLVVRWAERFRKDLAAIRGILVPTPDGAQVPLGQLARIAQDEGPSVVYREDGRRYAPVKFSVRGRDLGSTIAEAQALVRDRVKLPYGTRLDWGGEMNELREAAARLALVLPLTLLAIAFLVYSAVGRFKDMAIVLLGVPLAASGGILLLGATRTPLSISAAMGFVSLLGIAVQDALLVVNHARRSWAEGASLEEGALVAAERALRPTLMTACVALIGLLPAALSSGIGSETQKPLAVVVIGGAVALAILPRLLQAPLLVRAHRKDEVTAPGADLEAVAE